MKVLLAVCLLAVAVHGFSTPSTRARASSAVKVAAPPMNDEWSKPIPHRESTTPIPVNQVSKRERAQIKDRVIDPDFSLAAAVFLLGPLIAWYHPCKYVLILQLSMYPSFYPISHADYVLCLFQLTWPMEVLP